MTKKILIFFMFLTLAGSALAGCEDEENLFLNHGHSDQDAGNGDRDVDLADDADIGPDADADKDTGSDADADKETGPDADADIDTGPDADIGPDADDADDADSGVIDGDCPIAVAGASIMGAGSEPQPSIIAAPLQNVILHGGQSFDEEGEVIDWQWEILEHPPGINPTLEPTQVDPGDQDQSQRQLLLLTAGTYRIGLKVENESGIQSCEDGEVIVTAIPDQSIYIELTWTNPEDPDETNDFGSDLDLHLTKMGPGSWFENPYSVFYLNPNLSEAPIWNPEDPSLNRDERDGMGPEIISMATPAGCQWYAVGVHYYQQVFGTAYATARIYINGVLSFERSAFPLENTRNFWDVARIHWDSATEGATILQADNFHPLEPAGEAPEVTDDMSTSALCTAEALY